MIRNYFKVAWRNLVHNKVFSAINITGLAIGITCCLLMVLYLQHELSYDKFHRNADRIVRVAMEYSFSGGELSKGNYTSTKVFPAFKRNFPEVEDGVRMSDRDMLVKSGDKIFLEKKFLWADSTFFNVFTFKLLRGNPNEVLKAPRNVVLSQSAAKKYFGEHDPVGKTLLVSSDQEEYVVTGIAEDCPSNSQIKFDLLGSFSSFGPAQEQTYFNANYTTYLLLKNEDAITSLQGKIQPFMKKEMVNDRAAFVDFKLEPFTRIHLHSPYTGFEPNSNIRYIYIIAGIAILLLAIACFTYINLSTARSVERAREVGIRKVSGAYRSQVFYQFISESIVVTAIALVLSIGLLAFVLPAFNQVAGKELKFEQVTQTSVIAITLTLALVIALLAGSYPALVLSRFQPIKVLKGSFRNTSSGTLLRKSLIVFQFAISVFLIVSTIIIHGQLHYIQNKKLGYDREHVLLLNIDSKIMKTMDLVRNELKSNPDILYVSKANSAPVNIPGGYSMSRADINKPMNVKATPIDDEYVKASGIELIAGNDLSPQDVKDANQDDYSKNYYHFLLNESAVKMFGWTPEQAVGQKVFLGEQRPGIIKGVVRDFHFASLHTPVGPLVLFPGQWGFTVLVKTTGRDMAGTINFIATKWKQLAPHRPFEYRFMDEDYQKLYESEMRTGNVFNIFSVIAIVLACLGLFGLSAYSARQRIKEIGIRKVMGASAAQITLLLSNSFIKLVCIAFVIASPVAWYVMHNWLQDFAYRIGIKGWVFVLAGAIALLIALLTVSFQAIRAAMANPVNSLRTE